MTPLCEEEIKAIRQDMDQFRQARNEAELRRKGFRLLVDLEMLLSYFVKQVSVPSCR